MFKNKTLLITGGTGSFGNAVIKSFLNTGIKEIRRLRRLTQIKYLTQRHQRWKKMIRLEN